MLVLTVKDGDALWIGDARIVLQQASGARRKMLIDAPRDLPIGFERNMSAETLARLRADLGTTQEPSR